MVANSTVVVLKKVYLLVVKEVQILKDVSKVNTEQQNILIQKPNYISILKYYQILVLNWKKDKNLLLLPIKLRLVAISNLLWIIQM